MSCPAQCGHFSNSARCSRAGILDGIMLTNSPILIGRTGPKEADYSRGARPATDRLQCQAGIGGIFGRVFSRSGRGRQATYQVMPHGPTALVLAQEAED